MEGYLFVVDEAGTEISGSRRNLRSVETKAEYNRLYFQLESMMGEGCYIRDSIPDRRFDV